MASVCFLSFRSTDDYNPFERGKLLTYQLLCIVLLLRKENQDRFNPVVPCVFLNALQCLSAVRALSLTPPMYAYSVERVIF